MYNFKVIVSNLKGNIFEENRSILKSERISFSMDFHKILLKILHKYAENYNVILCKHLSQ